VHSPQSFSAALGPVSGWVWSRRIGRHCAASTAARARSLPCLRLRHLSQLGMTPCGMSCGRASVTRAVAEASYAALPALADMVNGRPNIAIDPALFLAASIIASADGPRRSVEVREQYADQVAAMRVVAEDKLQLVHDRVDFIYALQTLAQFEDLSVWQRILESLASGEVELECPSCGEHLYLELMEDQLIATTDPDDTRSGRMVERQTTTWVPRSHASFISVARIVSLLLKPNCCNSLGK
jgi:hypothetical protein